MRQLGVPVALALWIGAFSAVSASGQTPTPTPPAPSGCAPDAVLAVSDSMTSAPDINTSTGVVAWKSTQAFSVAFTAQNGNAPYPHGQASSAGGTNWSWSCAMAAGTTSPVSYTITFTASGKRLNGRIIIKKGRK